MLRLVSRSPVAQNDVAGQLTLRRPPNTLATARLYVAGFGPLALKAVGGVYLPTTATETVFGPPASGTSVNASLRFAETITSLQIDDLTGTLDSAINPNLEGLVQVQAGLSNRVLLPAAASLNAAQRLALVSSTGAISGGFTLRDTSPALKTRAVVFQGLMIRERLVDETTRTYGTGYFIMDERQGSKQRSGLMIFRRDP
jgi:hypothetical protein